MTLDEFLDIADDDDMVEVYADDGKTRPCELKLVSVFNVSDWVGGISDVMDNLLLYLNREVTCVATVKLNVPEDGEIVALRVYVEQEEGDEDVGEVVEDVRDKPNGQVKQELEGPNRSAVCEHLGFAHSILCDLVTLVGSSATDTVSEESVEALIRTAIDRVQRAGKAIGFKLGEVE